MTYFVNVVSDNATAPEVGSLRWAINEANANLGLDTIYFDFSDGTEFPDSPQTIFLDGAELLITDSVAIVGNGSDYLTVDGKGLSRVLKIDGGEEVSISGITIRGGKVADNVGAGVAIKHTQSVVLEEVVIAGNAGTGVSDGVGLYSSAKNLSLINSVVAGNTASGGGNGVGINLYEHVDGYSDVVIINSVIAGNSSTITTHQTDGAGIWTSYNVTLAVVSSVIADNVTSLENGAVTTNVSGVGISAHGQTSIIDTRVVNNIFTTTVTGGYAHGTGIYTGSALNVVRSEISGNTATSGPGAGIFAYGELNVLQSTIAYNQIETTGQAAGIYYQGSVDPETLIAQVINSTIYGNTVGNDPSSFNTAGIYSDSSNPLQLANSIVAGNLVYYEGSPTHSDLAGVVKSLSPNLIYNQGFTTIINPEQVIIGVDPQLIPELQDNAGPTRTMAPMPGSPIIDVGDNTFGVYSDTDQRGVPRILDGKLTGTPIIDLGAVEATATMSGVVFSDLNRNGIKEATEPGIFNVFIGFYALGEDGVPYTADDIEVGGMFTNAQGEYKFDTLTPGQLYAKVDQVYNSVYTVQNLTDPLGSRVYSSGPKAGYTNVYTLAGADVQSDINAGFVVASSISIVLFNDTGSSVEVGAEFSYGDGKYQSGFDTPIVGTKVTLTGDLDSGGTYSGSEVSDSDGNVLFGLLENGTYTITTETPDGLRVSKAIIGNAGGFTSTDQSIIQNINITEPTNATGYGFAYLPVGFINGAVFNDINGDGLREGSEPVVEGVTVKAYSYGSDGEANTDDDVLIGQTITGADGSYYFSSANPVMAYVQVDIGSVGAAFVTQQNLDEPNGNRADKYGNTPGYSIDPEVDNSGVLLGILFPATLGVTAQDIEPVEGMPITLEGQLADGSTFIQLLATDSNGYINFQGLRPGIYSLIPDTLTGYAINEVFVGNLGGDINPENNAINNITIESGSVGHGYQYTLTEVDPIASLAGIVFEDIDFNGVFDPTIDNPLPGVSVDLYRRMDDPSGGEFTSMRFYDYELVDTIMTSSDGSYTFSGLDSDDAYKITQNPAPGYILMRATPGASGGYASPLAEMSIYDILPINGQVSGGYQFANVKPNFIEGRLLIPDTDGGESTHAGIANVTVQLKTSNKFGGYDFYESITDANGVYGFMNLLPVIYDISVYAGVPGDLVIDAIFPGTGGGTADFAEVSIAGIDLSGKTDFIASTNDFYYRLAEEPVETVYLDSKSPITYLDDRGNRVTLSMTGAGKGAVAFRAGGSELFSEITAMEVIQHKFIQSISFTGTTSTTTFRVDAVALSPDHPLQTVIPTIEVSGDIGTIVAPRATFTKQINITGGVSNITFGDVVNDVPAYLSFNSSSAIKTTNLTFGVVRDLSVNATDVKISSLQAVAWWDGDSTPVYIYAGSIDRLTMTGRDSLPGNFEADLFLSGKGIAETAPTLNLVNIAGAITSSNWDIQGNIERINTRSGGDAWNLQATGLLAYLNTTRSLIQTNIEVQSIGVLSVRQHLIDTLIQTGEGFYSADSTADSTDSTVSTIAGVNVGGTIIDSVIDSSGTSVGTVLVNGNISGFTLEVGTLTRFNTGLSVYNSNIRANVIGSIFISLDLMGSVIQAYQPLEDNKTSIGRLTVYAVAYESMIYSHGSIDAVRFGHLVNSSLNVGYGYGGFYQTESGNVGSINTLYLSSTISYTDYKALQQSNIYAGYISSTKIYSVDESSETSDYGLTLHKLTTYARRQADGTILTLKNLSNSSSTPLIADQAGAYKLKLVQLEPEILAG